MHASAKFKKLLAIAYERMMNNGAVEDGYLKAIVFPIFKKGNRNEVQNYRGVSFMNVVVKIFAGVLKNRLTLWEQKYKILNEFQAGFRKGYSTNDNIFNLTNIIQIKTADKGKVYCFFVDFRAAFDSIDRQALFYKLHMLGVSTKFLRILRALYEGTSAAVWDGECISDWFQTTMGVKQGCILSPDLFAFFLNDLHDSLECGGICIEEILIRVLLYADDLVIMSDNAKALQSMIEKFSLYCKKWNLVVNLDKSKIVIFRKGGGRRSKNENWFIDGREIEIVAKYKYLGMILTPGLSWRDNFCDRVKTAKVSINSSWKSFLHDPAISFSAKYELFKAVARTIVGYGAQVWGYEPHEEVEKFQRYFIKRVLGLPERSPNYMIKIEAGIDNMFIYTLKCHMDYILQVLYVYEDHRLPKKIARIMINNNVGWFSEWMKISQEYGVNIDLEADNLRSMRVKSRELLGRIAEDKVGEARSRALASSCILYRQLNFNLSTRYITKYISTRKIRWIFKARGGLIGLNASMWREGERRLCSMCNLREEENVMHFLGICPILSEWRRKFFNSSILSQAECIDILNGVGNTWDNLYKYLVAAWKYRECLIAEFNT